MPAVVIETWNVECSPIRQLAKCYEELGEVDDALRTWIKVAGHKDLIEKDYLTALASEIADAITALANLANLQGIDLSRALDLCAERNRMRGRL